ncbi:MAG TPA: GrpB family protein [Candidatus Limnocylindrales bacterium]|nr:GrpB family protein [Candidatus Limnocylindrales bacterium]
MTVPIVIVDYDPTWPAQAFAEMESIRAALGNRLIAIEHIGSTSVPGLAAKPILDLLAGLRTLDNAPACIPLLATLGYIYVPEYEAEMPERRYFRKGTDGARTCHLHMVEIGSPFWARHLKFRDVLRTDSVSAAEYATLKRRLAGEYGEDRTGYTEAKTAFIRAMEARGR